MRRGKRLPTNPQLCSERVERLLQGRLESEAIVVAQPRRALRVLRRAVGRKRFYWLTGWRRKRSVWVDGPKLCELLGLRTAERRSDGHRACRSQFSKSRHATPQR